MTVETPIHPQRQADVEAWLTSLGATWEFHPDLAITKIDQAAGLANQVRHDPLHEEVVDRYAAAMVEGAVFPPIIATLDGHQPLGGNHRIAAAQRARRVTLAAYLVDATPQVLRRIRFEDNARHGLPPSPAERVEHAVALMADGMSQREAAAIVGIPQPKLSIAASALEATRRATDAGIDGFARLPEAVRYELGRLDHDAVFAAGARLALDTGVPVGTLRPLVAAAIGAEPTEALRLIGAEHEDLADRARDRAGNVRSSSRTPRARLDSAMAEIRSLVPIDIYDTCPNDDVRAVLAQRILDTHKVLAEAHKLLTEGVPT